MKKSIIIFRDKTESPEEFKKRIELTSLTIENQHHFEKETKDGVIFVIY